MSSTACICKEDVRYQKLIFLHARSSRTIFTISPSSLLSLSAKASMSTRTKLPRLIQITDRKCDGNSTVNSLPLGCSTRKTLLPVALITRARHWPSERTSGGVEVTAAAAKILRFGRAMFWPLACESATKAALRRQIDKRHQSCCSKSAFSDIQPHIKVLVVIWRQGYCQRAVRVELGRQACVFVGVGPTAAEFELKASSSHRIRLLFLITKADNRTPGRSSLSRFVRGPDLPPSRSP